MRNESSRWKGKLALKVSIGFVLAFLILAGICVFVPTDRSWEETKKQLEARGEVLDWEKVIPAAVPSEENIFADPIAASLLPIRNVPTPANPLGVPAPRVPPGSEALGIPFSMSNLVSVPLVADGEGELSLTGMDEWFSQWDESFARLREAGKRPKARLPGDYSSPANAPIPDFVAARILAQALASRASVHLVLGKSAEAFEDLETMQVVMKSFEAQPGTLVSVMIHVAIAGLYLQTIEEGLRRKLWADEELRKLTPRLLEMNLMRVVKNGIRAERAGVLRHLTAMSKRGSDPTYGATIALFSSSTWTVERAVIQFAPGSWFRQSQAVYATTIQGYLDGIDAEGKRIDQTRIDQQNAEFMELTQSRSPRNTIVRYVTPSFSKAARVMARNQNRAHELALACALQRYRDRQGEYPRSLERLAPDYIAAIPTNVFSAMPMRYEVNENGYELKASEPKANHPKDAGNFIFIGE